MLLTLRGCIMSSQPMAYVKKCILLALFMVMGIVSIAPIASAQQIPESMVLAPTDRKYNVQPGQVITDTMTVVNDGKVAYDLLVYARPYSVNNVEYEPNFTATPPNADAYKWVQFQKTLYHVEAGATQKIDFTMRVPQQANAGGHYGVVFAETQPTAPAQGTSVLRKKRLGMILYATVGGDYKSAGEVIGTDIPFWQHEPPLKVLLKAKNTGNTNFDVNAKITIRDVFGATKHTASKQFTLLPTTTRHMNMDWTNGPWFGLYNVEVEQTILDKTTKTNRYVMMMPRYIPFIIIVMLLVGGVYAWYRRRR